MGATEKRAALRGVALEARKAWAVANPPETPCHCGEADCAYPSHWAGARLDAAFDALVSMGFARVPTAEPQTADESPAPASVAAVAATVADGTDAASRALKALQDMVAASHVKPDLSEVKTLIERAKSEVIDQIGQIAGRTLTVKIADLPPVDVGLSHFQMPLACKVVSCGVNLWLAGPAGGGKTTMARQIAESLRIPFRFNGAIDTEYKLSGFVDANGRIVSTAFRDAYVNGGLYLFDEVDASLPPAVLAFNAALANGHADFPGCHEPVPRHPNFRVIAAANTIGQGGTFEYVGRNKMDAAFLDRFAFMLMEYDEALECAISGVPFTGRNRKAWAADEPDTDTARALAIKWVAHVQGLRRAAESRGLRVIISPRASERGVKMLANGIPWDDVVALEIRNKMTAADYSQIAG